MNISFDTGAFEGDPRGLIEVLKALHDVGAGPLGHHRDVERIVCRTPGMAMRYCREVTHRLGVSREAERVFLKNPGLGLHYLRLVGRPHFLDGDTQRRFWRKVVRSPMLAVDWAKTFGTRLSEEEEEVFVGDVHRAREYAQDVRKDAFPERIHNMLVLRTFEDVDEWSKRALAAYIEWAEPLLRKSRPAESKA